MAVAGAKPDGAQKANARCMPKGANVGPPYQREQWLLGAKQPLAGRISRPVIHLGAYALQSW